MRPVEWQTEQRSCISVWPSEEPLDEEAGVVLLDPQEAKMVPMNRVNRSKLIRKILCLFMYYSYRVNYISP
jgi:hypothetical protein